MHKKLPLLGIPLSNYGNTVKNHLNEYGYLHYLKSIQGAIITLVAKRACKI